MFIHDVYPTRTTRPAAKIRDGRPATEAYIIPISIAALREKLLTRFISRLFYIRWESKADASRAKQRASVDVLYDLFEKLSPKRIGKAMNNHVSAIVYYVREMLIVEFENPPPIMLKVLSALT